MPQPKRSSAREPSTPAALRDMLATAAVSTNGLLQATFDEVVRRGATTRQDAEELVQNLVAVGRRQARDALGDLVDRVRRAAGL